MSNISIITINLNNREGLARTMQSVIEQSCFRYVDYIIVDGDSTDGSLDVIRENERHLKHWVSEKDGGIYDAMNKGVGMADSEYCLFLNSGDTLHAPESIGLMLPYLTEDIVYGDLMIDGKVKHYADRLTKGYFLRESLPHPASFIRTKLLREKPYDTVFRIIADWIFFRESIEEGCTYRHADVVVSDFCLGGVSSDVRRVNDEKRRYKQSKECEISVIIPCYNQWQYVAETIASLKASTYKNWECIIVNDGSIDDSEAVIRRETEGDSRFRYYRNENHGVSYSRNYAIRKAYGKYILPLDADDLITADYIERAVTYMNSNPDTALFYGRAYLLPPDGIPRQWIMRRYTYETLLKMNCIYCSAVFCRSDALRIGGYDETMAGFEDWDFLIRLLYKNDKVYRDNHFVFYYRQHYDSRNFTARRNTKEIYAYIREKNRDIYEEYGLSYSRHF